jgi:hypothetical protein
MVPFELALRLREAGLRWQPAMGDKFSLKGPEMVDDVFVLSNMVADVHHFPDGQVIGFNGTTEWALDSVNQDDAVWLPSEEQLRERLGAEFVSLARVGDGYRVTLRSGDFAEAATVDQAYALALLRLVEPGAELEGTG